MLSRPIFNKLRIIPNYLNVFQKLTNRTYNEMKKPPDADEKHNLGDVGSKYKLFKDEDAEIILDVNEERQKYRSMLEAEEAHVQDPFEGINLERGKAGVFEIEDLVTVLKRENAVDVFVAAVPANCKYVDYICVVSGNSKRHMNAMAQFVRRVFKQKRFSNDVVPKLEGKYSDDWMAIDLGNIALHIFSREARSMYDLDSLWSVGSEFDEECNKKDPLVEMYARHTIYLHDLQPAS